MTSFGGHGEIGAATDGPAPKSRLELCRITRPNLKHHNRLNPKFLYQVCRITRPAPNTHVVADADNVQPSLSGHRPSSTPATSRCQLSY